MDKQKVKQHFSSIASVYDKFATPQARWGSKLISLLPQKLDAAAILDIGMGTGNLTIELANVFKQAKIYGCDISSTMIECARKKAGSRAYFDFSESDFEKMPYKNNFFDIIFSNMSFQWSSDFKATLKEASRVLKKGGKIYFTIPGKKTLKESKTLFENNGLKWQSNHNFTDEETIKSLLKEAGFANTIIETHEEKLKFKDFLTFINWLKLTGSNTGVDTGLNGFNLGKALIKLNKESNLKFTVTFEIQFVHAQK
ncbi:MAG: hypothetical protein A2252_12710 [Elusimicrobia bacterium RIFOXYA2_FULL_39_19]|nr:MAG: hypothetical protein A2252_12710 [Elusimicrobia bacterium RIFOXYA2_FULL_39_19]